MFEGCVCVGGECCGKSENCLWVGAYRGHLSELRLSSSSEARSTHRKDDGDTNKKIEEGNNKVSEAYRVPRGVVNLR